MHIFMRIFIIFLPGTCRRPGVKNVYEILTTTRIPGGGSVPGRQMSVPGPVVLVSFAEIDTDQV
jgi:hypothetical protein